MLYQNHKIRGGLREEIDAGKCSLSITYLGRLPELKEVHSNQEITWQYEMT